MPNYSFYKTEYHGDSISEDAFPRLAARAGAQLEQYKREFTVVGDLQAESMAICAMADAIFYFEAMANGGIVSSVSIGSVSTGKSGAQVDISARAQAKELYSCAKQYLSIYRGAAGC